MHSDLVQHSRSKPAPAHTQGGISRARPREDCPAPACAQLGLPPIPLVLCLHNHKVHLHTFQNKTSRTVGHNIHLHYYLGCFTEGRVDKNTVRKSASSSDRETQDLLILMHSLKNNSAISETPNWLSYILCLVLNIQYTD